MCFGAPVAGNRQTVNRRELNAVVVALKLGLPCAELVTDSGYLLLGLMKRQRMWATMRLGQTWPNGGGPSADLWSEIANELSRPLEKQEQRQGHSNPQGSGADEVRQADDDGDDDDGTEVARMVAMAVTVACGGAHGCSCHRGADADLGGRRKYTNRRSHLLQCRDHG